MRASYRRWRAADAKLQADEADLAVLRDAERAWWRLPVPLRVAVLLRQGKPGDALREVAWRTPGTVEAAEQHHELMEHLSQIAAAVADLVPLAEAQAGRHAELLAEVAALRPAKDGA